MSVIIPAVYVLPGELELPPHLRRASSLRPSQAADALRLPVSVLVHAYLSGQVPTSVWFWHAPDGGRPVLRFRTAFLAAWAATCAVIDTRLPTLPELTAVDLTEVES